MIKKQLLNLVFGGSSFIGRNLIKELEKNPENVIVAPTREEFDFFAEDKQTQLENLHDKVRGYEDVKIYHLAGLGSSHTKFAQHSSIDHVLLTTHMTNTVFSWIKGMVHCNSFELIFASSVGGDRMRTKSFATGYDVSKAYQNILAKGFPEFIRAVKLPSVFGPDMDLDDRLVPNVVRGKLRSPDFNPNQIHPMCYIDSAVEMLIYPDKRTKIYNYNLDTVWREIEYWSENELSQPTSEDRFAIEIQKTVKGIKERLK